MISVIAREFFEKSPVLALPLLGLAIFAVTFLFILWQASRMSDEEVKMLSALPVGDESTTTTRGDQDEIGGQHG